MSGLDLQFHGQTKSSSHYDKQGWKFIQSDTHRTVYWSCAGGSPYRYEAGGLLHPTIVIQTQRWWTVRLFGVVSRKGRPHVQLGPITVIFEKKFEHKGNK